MIRIFAYPFHPVYDEGGNVIPYDNLSKDMRTLPFTAAPKPTPTKEKVYDIPKEIPKPAYYAAGTQPGLKTSPPMTTERLAVDPNLKAAGFRMQAEEIKRRVPRIN